MKLGWRGRGGTNSKLDGVGLRSFETEAGRNEAPIFAPSPPCRRIHCVQAQTEFGFFFNSLCNKCNQFSCQLEPLKKKKSRRNCGWYLFQGFAESFLTQQTKIRKNMFQSLVKPTSRFKKKRNTLDNSKRNFVGNRTFTHLTLMFDYCYFISFDITILNEMIKKFLRKSRPKFSAICTRQKRILFHLQPSFERRKWIEMLVLGQSS